MHPATCGDQHVQAFLTYLTEKQHVSANTQKVALNALVFMYRHVIKQELGDLGFTPSRKQRHLPVVLSRSEIRDIFLHLSGRNKLIFQLLYGSGLRISECLQLRIKDIDLENRSITVVNGKGKKDRQTLLAETLIEPLKIHIQKAKELMAEDAFSRVGVAMEIRQNWWSIVGLKTTWKPYD